MKGLGYFIALAIVALFVYLGFKAERWFNFKFAYEKKIELKIKELVKDSCLK